jgi:prepilin peptidase CpaA
VTDWKDGKVYNYITYPSIILGILLSFFFQPPEPSRSITGLAAGFLVFGILWQFAGLGAGDAKLMAALGALKGIDFIFYSSFYTLCAAAIAGLVILIFQGKLLSVLKWVFLTLISVFIRNMTPPSLENRKTEIPFAPFIFIGTVYSLYLEYINGQPFVIF